MTVTRTRAVVFAAASLVAVLVAWVVVSLLTAGADAPVRTSFRDVHGRVCTQVVWQDTVDVDCEFRGFGSALGGWLDNPPTPPVTPKPTPNTTPTVQLIPNWK